jgi:pyruvate dehydrogenase E2 component (dihydrolipoamide acetyltransferase)
MATPVMMPRQGQSVESCILVEWLVAEGDAVVEGQPLANIETDKAVFELESPAAGTVLAFFAEAGDDVPVLANIAAVGESGEDVSNLKPNGATPPAAQPAASAKPDASAAPRGTAPAAPAAGASGAASPRARKRAQQSGVDLSQVAGSGPGGRIVERDVLAVEQSGGRISPAARAAMQERGLQSPGSGSGPGGLVMQADLTDATAPPEGTQMIPLSGIRKIIAQRMHASLATTAQLTLTSSFNAAAILEARKQVKAAEGGPDITLNDMIVFAAAQTLVAHPALNAHFLGDQIARFDDANVGVDTPRGLMVPVLDAANTLAIENISAGLKELFDAAKTGKISPDKLQGGTFTITNMGMLGVETFTPVLNVPEVAILGIGGPSLRPVEVDGEIQYIKAIPLSLTIDHQALDGAPGARFLQALVAALESFEITN